MPRTSIRSLARSLAASGPALETVDPPEPEKLDSGDEATALSGDTVEVEEIEGRTAASDPQSEHPAPRVGEDAQRSDWHEEAPWWAKYGVTEERAAEQIRNMDSIRGQQANELGRLRRQVDLTERAVRLLLVAKDPFERQALLQALSLIREPKTWPAIEQMLDVGEQTHEPERWIAV